MAVRFDADTDRLTSTTGLPDIATITVTCWVYIEADRNALSTIWAFDSATDDGFYLTLDADGTTPKVFDGGENVGGAGLTVGQWYKLAGVVDGNGAATHMRLYAAAEGSALVKTQTDRSVGAVPNAFWIGAHPGFPTRWLNGRVAALKVWSVALTDAEIDAEFTQAAPVKTAGLNRYHPLVSDLNDASGNGYHLTAGSTAISYVSGPAALGGATLLNKLRLGAGTVSLRVGTAAASKAYIGTTQVWP